MNDDLDKYEIFVNAQPKKWGQEVITYTQVVKLAFPNAPTGPSTIYTVTYSRGTKDDRQGTLVEGQSADVGNGMAFDVTRTDKS